MAGWQCWYLVGGHLISLGGQRAHWDLCPLELLLHGIHPSNRPSWSPSIQVDQAEGLGVSVQGRARAPKGPLTVGLWCSVEWGVKITNRV